MAMNRDHELYTYPDQRNQNASSQYSTISPLHQVKCYVVGILVISCLVIALLVSILVGVSYISVKISLDGGEKDAEVVPQEMGRNFSSSDEQLAAIVIHLGNIEEKTQNLSMLDEQLAAIMIHLENIQQNMTRIWSTLKQKDCQESGVEYRYNPYSGTCVRRIVTPMNWTSAKSYCERSGQHLVTFDSIEASNWLIHQQQNECWDGYLWIGGQLSSEGKWEWHGLLKGAIVTENWAPTQPSRSATEVYVSSTKDGWHDHHRADYLSFLCEF